MPATKRTPITTEDLICYICPICEEEIEQPPAEDGRRPLVFHPQCKPKYQYQRTGKRFCAYKPCGKVFFTSGKGGASFHPDCKIELKKKIKEAKIARFQAERKCQFCDRQVISKAKKYKKARICVDCSLRLGITVFADGTHSTPTKKVR